MATNLPATKTNLIKLKDELAFAVQGHDLLDQKRSILVVELLTLVDQAVDYQSRVEKALGLASISLENTILHEGRLKTGNLAASINITSDYTLSERKVMGVHLPKVDTDFQEHGPYFSPEGTTVLVEETIAYYREALKLMGRLAELKVSIMRLAREVKKTIRKVNSLEKIVIPDTRSSLKDMSQKLEEADRESHILLKTVKDRLDRPEKGI
ncbi:MAG: V-type ATP synthase subunit D [Sphaerochaetaceae bacterium]|jgi:V/A-type H+-transporting ATPase subunit D|nr:V-type ATP synthase subunit D [Sphaerochaetaceae bacterium]MDD3163432.1 V-type ATP synthase subunit D [Sphaerochaetaceae bacterium]MDD4007640.1 V-type ATP synthase subunit D [Sphaerochaetaceae bacterium]MDD4396582.1 V-type ATP synthase subunit D [Sphaerochaetaceae bacterium]